MSEESMQGDVATKLGLNEDQLTDTDRLHADDITKSDTPETLLPDYSDTPDITLVCDLCNEYVNMCYLPYHRLYHQALAILDYTTTTIPQDIKSLSQQRNLILKNLQTIFINEKQKFHVLKKVNAAFEELKNYVDETIENFDSLGNKLDTSVTSEAFSCSCECVLAVGTCSSENSRWKSCMEDFLVYQDYFGEDSDKSYFAIFDGYNGANAAQRSSMELHHLLLCEMMKFDSRIRSTNARNFVDSVEARRNYEVTRQQSVDSVRVNLHQESTAIVQNLLNLCYEKYETIIKDQRKDVKERGMTKKTHNASTEEIHKAFKKVYLLTDILLSYGQDEVSKVRWSGTSALTIIIQNMKREANKNGKTACSIVRLGVNAELTSEETIAGDDVAQPEAIGFIHLANVGNSKALLIQDCKPRCLTQDHTAKNPKERKRVLLAGGNFSNSEKERMVNGVLSVTRGLGNHGDQKLKNCVIVDPYLVTVPIDTQAQLLVLASDGIWQVLSDQEVATLLVKMLPGQKIPPCDVNESILPLLHSLPLDDSCVNCLNPDLALPGQVQENENLQQDQKIWPSGEDHISGTNECNDADMPVNQLSMCQDCLSSSSNHSNFQQLREATKEEMRKELSKSMAEQLTQAALMAGAKDNVSVIVVLLPGSGI